MAKAAQLKDFKPDAQRPAFIPYDLTQLQSAATGTARDTVRQTEAFRAARHPEWDRALKLGETGIRQDVEGDTTLMPMVQAEAMRAGLGDSLGAFGDATGTLSTGTGDGMADARTAKVSTNLFGTANALGQQIRSNRYRALQIGSQVYPDTQIGLSGQDAALISGANTLGYNSFNEANYRDELENERLNWRVQAENQRAQIQQQNVDSAASAQSSAANQQAMIQGGAAIAGVAVLAIAL